MAGRGGKPFVLLAGLVGADVAAASTVPGLKGAGHCLAKGGALDVASME